MAVASGSSVASAARDLGVIHTTVMRRVQAFEAQTNIKIFERLRSGYKTTPEGEIFLNAAAAIDSIVSDLDRKIAGGDLADAGELSITATDSIFPVVAAHMSEFNSANPNINTDIAVTNNQLNLDKRDADIAIRVSNNPPGHLVGRRVCDIQFAIFATKKLLADSSLLPLNKCRWLGMEFPITASAASEWMDQNINSRRIVMRSNSFVALCTLAENGLGYAILPAHLGDCSNKLVRVPNDEILPTTGLWLLSHRDVLQSPRVRKGMDFLYEKLRAEQKMFEGQ